ncbi:expressed unknown protein [Seminavis robusta]|uniref:Uncharacterized protein n=1 Tax=Seminavis robusta TaxID=568900 RepID=A0A9N8DYD2_9STRA|nr:expressed unknown protein [Seminavis robusta]|eukprot:Sro450_g145440.1 n/a (361) ;mRNA; f:3515-4597
MSDYYGDSGEESSGYSYKDFAIYQFSDVDEDDSDVEGRPKPTGGLDNHDDDNDEDALWNNWGDYDNESYVMHAQSDNEEFDLYQFSDEDLIPEEPDEDWIVAALMNNRRDFDHLELILPQMEDFARFIRALEMNQVVKSVTIYEAFFDAIPNKEEKEMLAETVCNIPSLETLKVYYHSSHFVEPLDRIRPSGLKNLCLMFFPEKPDNTTLTLLTRLLKGDNTSTCTTTTEQDDTSGGTTITTTINTPPALPLTLESLSLRCDVMDDAFIESIALGMRVNPSVTTLSFWGNNVHVTEEGALNSSKIDFYLRLNQCDIRDMHLYVNAEPTEFLDKIVSERESTDLVFYLLQTNPSFLSYLKV